MIIKNKKKDCPFAQIDRSVLEDNRISWRARGILAYLLSKPPEWEVMMEDVHKHGPEGRDAVRSAMQELQKAGYAKLVNKLQRREWHIFESPQKTRPENPQSTRPENPQRKIRACTPPGNTPPEKHNDWESATSNKEEESNKELSNKEPEQAPEDSSPDEDFDIPLHTTEQTSLFASSSEAEKINIPSVLSAASKKRSKGKAPVHDLDPWCYDMADWFKTTLPETIIKGLTPRWRDNWAKAFDDLLRIDHANPDDIRDAVNWARNDESFWKENFNSPTKLRDRDKNGIRFFNVFLTKSNHSRSKKKTKLFGLDDQRDEPSNLDLD